MEEKTHPIYKIPQLSNVKFYIKIKSDTDVSGTDISGTDVSGTNFIGKWNDTYIKNQNLLPFRLFTEKDLEEKKDNITEEKLKKQSLLENIYTNPSIATSFYTPIYKAITDKNSNKFLKVFDDYKNKETTDICFNKLNKQEKTRYQISLFKNENYMNSFMKDNMPSYSDSEKKTFTINGKYLIV